MGEVTPSIGEEVVYGRCWEVQDGDTLIQCSLEVICVIFWLFGNGSFVHHHGFWILVMSSPFILYLQPYIRPNQCTALLRLIVDNAVGEFLKGGCMMAIVYPVGHQASMV